MANDKFRPVRGLEKNIKSSAPVEGYVYFSTDTKKIFLAKDGEYLPMGGNSGIYYANRVITEEEKDEELTSFIFTPDDLEGDQTPNIDDLILNLYDGGFYRVVGVNEDGSEVTGERLAVAGTGVGPGTGPGTGTSLPVIMDPLKGADRYFITNQGAMNISFYCTSQQATDNRIETVQYLIGTQVVYTDTKGYDFNETINFDISPYTGLLSTSTRNTLGIRVTDVYGNQSTRKNFYLYLIELNLYSDFSTISLLEQDILNYPCMPTGGAGLGNRYIRITMAPVDNPTNYILDQQTTVTSTNSTRTIPVNVEGLCTHGVYVLNASFCALLENGQTVSSPVLSHQIIYYDMERNTPLIAAHVPSTSVSQYDTLNISYMIADKQASSAEVNVILYTNGEVSTEVATLNRVNTWKKVFTETGIYTLEIQYKSLREELPKISVIPYEGDMPTIDDTNLELYLTAQGRNNNEANKDSWDYKNIEGKFENFLWGNANGWLEDPDGNTALKLTNGAKFSLPTYHPFATDATINGLTIELDFMFSGVLDYSQPLIKCLSTYTGNNNIEIVQTGFNITGQKATLNSSINKATTDVIGGEEDESGNINEVDMALQAFTQFFNEDERIHLSYVIERIPPMENIVAGSFYFVYTYLNGVLSGIMRMSVDTDNNTHETFIDNVNNPASMIFDSTYGDIYIYNVRVYRNALDTRTIINNYIADLTDVDEKIELFKINNIFDDAGFISLNAIQDISYQLEIPYVLLKGGSLMEKKKTDSVRYTETPEYRLPLTKSDYRLMSMQMFNRLVDNENPVIDIPINLQDNANNVVTDFKNIALNTEYKPVRGVQVYGQGTSSMVYPVKNLRLKFIQDADYPTVYDGSYPVEIVCFKADFMDSSSSHNTGTANLVYDLYANLNMKSPAQQFRTDHINDEGIEKYDLVTAIRGFPIIVFYAEGNSDAYTYVGRYNFNLDKATPEPFGFIPQKVYTGQTTTDDQGRTRKEIESVGLKTEVVNGMIVLPLDEEGNEIEKDLVQCWEVLNNDNGSPTKFLTLKDVDENGALKYNTFRESLTKENNWLNYYEDRYPDELVGDTEDGVDRSEDLKDFFDMATWINSTATEEVSNIALEEPAYYITRDNVYNPEKQYYSAPGVEQEIIISDGAGISTGGLVDNYLTPTIVVGTFAEKVGRIHNQYTFSYDEGVWFLLNPDSEDIEIGPNLVEYGISYTGTPVTGNTLVVNYYSTNNWSSTLFEKFEVDNRDYRLAKFKAEFEEHFNLDFTLFYYVLTMVLLMMDSRAKNMMLASWDRKIWYPIFYDMDTALGVNNTGFNKFSYDTEDDPEDKVFNGFDSVLWNNVRECFYDEICEFYSEIRTYLTVNKLLTTYNANASDKWNEALTSADAEYKYIRPYEEGYYDGAEGVQINPGQVSYLYAGQGKRTNHRSYWLNNRVKYFDSKYLPPTYGAIKPSQANTFSFRAYALPEQKNTANAEACIAQTPANHQFDITALNNSYQSLFIGNIVYGPEYTAAGQTVKLGPTQVKHEVESYILNPDLISNLGDLSDKYIGQLNFPGVQTRLTELNFGRSSRSHKEYDKYYNNLLSALNIGTSCPYLQSLNIARCTGLIDISLNNCPRLRKVDAEGSKLTNINFPANSILEELYLPNTLTSLTLTNQPYLHTIQFDDLAIGSRSIQTISLDRIDAVNTYPIVRNVFNTNNIKSYYLNKVEWVIEDQDLVDGFIENIDILDILSDSTQANPREGYTVAQALSGTITVNVTGKVNEFAIYDKYNKIFPNVTIKYGDKVEIIKAKRIQFMDNDVESEASLFYEVYGDGVKDLGYLTSEEGPNGVALGVPAKSSTDANDFEFTGRWKHNDTLYTTIKEEIEAGALSLYDIVPEEDMIFYPEYTTVPRKYSIKFYDWDGTLYIDDNLEWQTEYSVPNFLYRDSSELDVYERWAFQGWSLTNYGDTVPANPVYIDVSSNLVVTGNFIAYAHYIKEDVRTNATRDEYFEFDNYQVEIDGTAYTGYQIKIKDSYREILAGKVTLPDTYNGIPIISVGNFQRTYLITHVFFINQDSNNYIEISNNAFYNDSYLNWDSMQLSAIYLPTSIRRIGANGFRECRSLIDLTWNNNIIEIGNGAFQSQSMRGIPVKMNELPLSLKTLDSYAFFGTGDDIIISKVPSQLQSIGSSVAWTGNNVIIDDFNGSLKTIEQSALIYAGNNINTDTIYIRKNVVNIERNAFGESGNSSNKYGKGKIKNIYFENPYTTYLAGLGLEEDETLDMTRVVAEAMGFNVNDETVSIAFNWDSTTE